MGRSYQANGCSTGSLLAVIVVAGAAAALPASLAAQSSAQGAVKSVTGFASPTARARLAPDFARTALRLPAGFQVAVFAEGLGGPRMLAVGDDGTVYVTRRDSGDVLALRDDGSGRAGPPRKVVTDLRRVHGIALHRGRMYLATIKEVYVADLMADGSVSAPRAIVTDLPDGGQHPNRTIGVGPDGMLYISVGSTCNRCAETTPEAAALLRTTLDGRSRGIYASGLRNTIGWAWHPQSRELWGMDHGSDWGGNDLPPEELNRLLPSSHYGWPYCFGNRVIDSLYIGEPEGGTKADFCPRTIPPALTYQAHSAPIQLAFYDGRQFPADYRGDAFVAMRGSWNRNPPTGYKVVRIRFRNGQPVAIEDFLTGFLSADRRSHYGRVAGIAVARDGSLLVGDDTNGVIYRVTYGRGGG